MTFGIRLKELTSRKLRSKPIYDYKYVKTKVRSFNGVVHTNFRSEKIPKESTIYICLTIITVESVLKMDKKYYPQVYLEQCKYAAKEKKMTSFKDAELELDSGNNSNSE